MRTDTVRMSRCDEYDKQSQEKRRVRDLIKVMNDETIQIKDFQGNTQQTSISTHGKNL